MQYKLDHIETFVTLVEEKSFGQAAKKLHKVRSAISYDIQCLESSLGVELFDRSMHKTQLTQEGEQFFVHAKRLLLNAHHIWHVAKQLASTWEAKLLIVVDGIIPMEPILRVVKRFEQENIPTQIVLQVGFLQGVVSQYRQNSADMMLVAETIDLGTDYITTEIPAIECQLVVSATYGIDTTKTVYQTDLEQYTEIQVQGSSENFRHTVGARKQLIVTDFMCKKQAIAMNMGFGWLPTQLVQSEIDNASMVVIPYEHGETYPFRAILARHKGDSLGKAGMLFWEYILEEFG
jgi:DNA-binding transcriptional LysR family regulator